MSKFWGFAYNKGHQKSRKSTREIWCSEGELNIFKDGLTHSICPPSIHKMDIFECFELISQRMLKNLKFREQGHWQTGYENVAFGSHLCVIISTQGLRFAVSAPQVDTC